MNQFLFLLQLGNGEVILGNLKARSGAEARQILDRWVLESDLVKVEGHIVGVRSRTFQADRIKGGICEPIGPA